MSLVLDASVTLSWLIERIDPEEQEQSIAVLRTIQLQGAQVPVIWFIEVANGILVAERRAILKLNESPRFMALVASLPIDRDKAAMNFAQAEALRIARSFDLTAYDATYLELSLRTKSTLATFDRKLAAAARSAGVPVFGDT